MHHEYSPDPELDEILVRCSESLEQHCLTFHGSPPGAERKKRFSRPFSKRHHEFFEVWDDPKVQKILAICHRGWGKTSLFNLGAPSQAITFGKYKFIMPVSATATGAEMQSENLKMELTSNVHLKTVLGEIKGHDTWAKGMWETSNGVMVLPRGRGQQVRGLLRGDTRPDLILVDDVEDDESVMTIEQRRKTEKFFFSQLQNTVDRSSDSWRIVVIGTILHEASLLLKLKEDPTWTVLDFPLCSPDYKSYWPQFLDDEACVKLRDDYDFHGELDAFYREYMNQPMAKEDAVFRKEYFKYYSERIADISAKPHVETFILVDPAKTEKVHNAFTALIAVSIEFVPKGNKIFIRECVNEHYRPDQIIRGAFDLADKWGAKVIGYEVTGLNEFITQPMKDEMYRRGKDYELIELQARKGEGDFEAKNKGKSGRVGALAPYYRNGAIYHNDDGSCQVLEDQLLSFPRSRYWDVMDATAYIIQMLTFGDRHMTEEWDGEDVIAEEEERKELEKLWNSYDEELDESELEEGLTYG